MKTKFTGILLTLMLLAGLMVGCSSSSGNTPSEESKGSSEPKRITWWVPNWDETVARELVKQFESENPDIKADIVITTWDTMETKIRTALATDSVPDLITELESRIKGYAANDWLTNLDPYFAKDLDKNDFITSAMEINTYNGSVYGVPFRHDGSGVLYNKKMFREAGLDPNNFPKTWDEFMDAAKKLTKDTNNDGEIDQYGMAWPLGNQANAVTRYIQLLYSEGGDILNADGTAATLNTPEAIEAMRKLAETFKSGVAPKSAMELDNTGLRGLFVNEKIAMYIGGQFDIDPIKKENPNIDLGTAVIPGPDGMGTTTVNGFSLIIPKSAKNKDEAWALTTFIAEPENMAKLTATFPARKSALELPKFEDPLLKPFAAQLDKGKSEPSYEKWPEIEKIIFKYIQLVILNNADIADSMNKMTDEINQILK